MVAIARRLLPATTRRVQRGTSEPVNRRVQRDIERRVDYFAAHADEIDARLRALDREWDIERALEANAASLALAGVLLGAFTDRRFLALPGLVSAFLLQHAVQGWCPPLPVLRRLGFRTADEIHTERTALKALRGDFDEVRSSGPGAVARLLRAIRR